MKKLISFILLLSLLACEHPQEERPVVGRTNYVILLDLSDRLLTEGQVERDLAIIAHAAEQFTKKVAKQMYITSNDRFKVVVAPQQGSPLDLAHFDAHLSLDMARVPLPEKKDVHQKMDKLLQQVRQLYQAAVFSDKANDYQGADIWKYLKEQLTYDVLPNPNPQDRNKVIVLTDGYLNFESYRGKRQIGKRYASTVFVKWLAKARHDWPNYFEQEDYGILPPENVDFTQVEWCIAEVQPKADYHLEILEATWRKWLGEMQSPEVTFVQRGSLSTTRERLSRFLQAKDPQP